MRNVYISCLIIGIAVLFLSPASYGDEGGAEGKICGALYTVHDKIMKMTVQMYDLGTTSTTVTLETDETGTWQQVATATVDRTDNVNIAHFRITNWTTTKDINYRVRHESSIYQGRIKKDPIDKETITVFVFTGNSVSSSQGGQIPKTDIIDSIIALDPDLLFFSGDQVYNHTEHDVWWKVFLDDNWGSVTDMGFGRVIRNYPTVTIPDDHDVGQNNLWGESGIKSYSENGPDGGYYRTPSYVQKVEKAQTSHLPDPYDPTPVQNGIGVYYTDLTVGGISFAILEDRKFKTGPDIAASAHTGWSRVDHVINPNYDPSALDVPGAVLLGDRQLDFLRDWAADWQDCQMKAVLSQTIFCGGAHLHGSLTYRVYADLDANGWPQTGRNKALYEMRKAFAVHLAGDQHLGTVFHHGIDEWNDAGYSLCVPSIANFYIRWWDPENQPGGNYVAGMPLYTGEYLDGFNNKITCWAVANPNLQASGGALTTRAAGFGIAKFNKTTRQIDLELWPRGMNVTAPTAYQYPGWPVTIHQEDNYGRQATAYLPTLVMADGTDPVIQIIEESSREIVYTLRIKGTQYRPKVFASGTYTIHVDQGTNRITLTGINALSPEISKTILVTEANVSGPDGQPDDKVNLYDFVEFARDWQSN